MDRLTEAIQAVKGIALRAMRVSPGDDELDLRSGRFPAQHCRRVGLGRRLHFQELRGTDELPCADRADHQPADQDLGEQWGACSRRAGLPWAGRHPARHGRAYVSTGLSAGNWSPSVAATVADLSITREKLADGALTADVLGRAKMADAFVTLAKMNVDFITAMTEKANLDSGDFIPGYSTSDTAFRKYAGSDDHPGRQRHPDAVRDSVYRQHERRHAVIPQDDTIPQIGGRHPDSNRHDHPALRE